MSSQAVSHLAAWELDLLRVVGSIRGRGHGAGLCIEFYGRSPRNAWFEALRVDGYVGDVHYHSFSEDGATVERPISQPVDREAVVDEVADFVTAEATPLLVGLGFGSATTTPLTEVVTFLRTGVFAEYLRPSGENIRP